jgi:3',5'-cyclic-AMP phosphodiesterase
MTRKEAPVVFVVPGDLHLTEPGRDNHRTALWMVGEVNELIRPDFVQFIGDNAQHAAADEYRLFRDLTDRLCVPWYALVGDHDVHEDPEAQAFRAHIGDTYGATSLGGFRFLRLNTQQGKPEGLSAEQIDRFRSQVDEALAAGERVVLFQHNYPYQIWENFTGPGIDDWGAVVQTRRITVLITGHTHYWQVANDGRNVTITTRSIGDPEGGPAGYTIGYVSGDDLAVRYRSVEDKGPVVLITHPRERLLATGPAHVVAGQDQIRARIWSAEAITIVERRIDEGSWTPLQPFEGGEWADLLPGGQLSKGEHALDVRVVDVAGERGEQRICFAVDPSGRYTAVPEVRPAVASTGFC